MKFLVFFSGLACLSLSHSPVHARFLQTDPIGYKDQMNLYAYVGNDPINFFDPLGLCAVKGGEITQCEVNLPSYSDLSDQQQQNLSEDGFNTLVDDFVADIVAVGEAIQENGSTGEQQAWDDISDITVTLDDGPFGTNRGDSLTFNNPALTNGRDEARVTITHEIFHSTPAARGMRRRGSSDEQFVERRAVNFGKENNLISESYTRFGKTPYWQ